MSTEVTIDAPSELPPEPLMQVRLIARGVNGQFLIPEKYFAELLDWLSEHAAKEVR